MIVSEAQLYLMDIWAISLNFSTLTSFCKAERGKSLRVSYATTKKPLGFWCILCVDKTPYRPHFISQGRGFY